jgi:hypothetical protein
MSLYYSRPDDDPCEASRLPHRYPSGSPIETGQPSFQNPDYTFRNQNEAAQNNDSTDAKNIRQRELSGTTPMAWSVLIEQPRQKSVPEP